MTPDLRYLTCRVALNALAGIERAKALPKHVLWERLFNTCHRSHTPDSIDRMYALLCEYNCDKAAITQEMERLARMIDQPQNVRVK